MSLVAHAGSSGLIRDKVAIKYPGMFAKLMKRVAENDPLLTELDLRCYERVTL